MLWRRHESLFLIDWVCIAGAGLDTRAWRLHLERKLTKLPADGEAPGSTSVEYVPATVNPLPSSLTWFEVDFPEIFEFKLKALETAGARLGCNYKTVQTDLSLPDWPEKLLAAGTLANGDVLIAC
jgi:O-methyltransferase involved in polyketide biosynthesis